MRARTGRPSPAAAWASWWVWVVGSCRGSAWLLLLQLSAVNVKGNWIVVGMLSFVSYARETETHCPLTRLATQVRKMGERVLHRIIPILKVRHVMRCDVMWLDVMRRAADMSACHNQLLRT